MEEVEFSYKVILLGNSGVGKTNLINIATGKSFSQNESATITGTYSRKTINLKGQKFAVDLWDTCGQEKFRSLTRIFLRGAKIIIFVYDITDRRSYDELTYWVEMAQETEVNCIFGIVGNKIDLFLNEVVPEELARDFAKSKNYKFRLVSAKQDPESFNKFLEELVQDYNELYHINDPNYKNISFYDEYYGYEEKHSYYITEIDYHSPKKGQCCSTRRERHEETRKYRYKYNYEKYTPKFEKFKHFMWPKYKPKFKLRLKSKEKKYK